MATTHIYEQEVYSSEGALLLKVIADSRLGGVTIKATQNIVIDTARQGNLNYFIDKARTWYDGVDASAADKYLMQAITEEGLLIFEVVAEAGVTSINTNNSWLEQHLLSRLWYQLYSAQYFNNNSGAQIYFDVNNKIGAGVMDITATGQKI
jgi:hypothetical protein